MTTHPNLNNTEALIRALIRTWIIENSDLNPVFIRDMEIASEKTATLLSSIFDEKIRAGDRLDPAPSARHALAVATTLEIILGTLDPYSANAPEGVQIRDTIISLKETLKVKGSQFSSKELADEDLSFIFSHVATVSALSRVKT